MISKSKPGVVTPGRIPKTPPYEVGIDWLDFTLSGLSGYSEAEELIRQIGILTQEQFDFSATRPIFNGKNWDGSGRGDAGTLLWYSAPTSCDPTLRLNEQGRYVGYEDILPPRHVRIEDDALEYARSHLPTHIKLFRADSEVIGECDHGWRLKTISKFNLDACLKVAMSAQILARVAMRDLFEWLSAMPNLRFTRIDIALDDMRRYVELDRIEATVKNGDFFDASYRCVIESGNRGEAVGKTIYLGSPASDKRLRIYDKFIESKGERDCIRWEAELRRAKADVFGHALIDKFQQSWQQCTHYMQQVVCGLIDFRYRKGDDEKNRARCPMVSWWMDMLEQLKTVPALVRVPKIKQTLQRSIDWIEKSVAPSIAAIASVLGNDFISWFSDTVEQGSIRMNNIKRLLVQTTSKEALAY